MKRLKNVEYKNVNGQMVASELYDDGSIREVKITNGMVDYILTGEREFGKEAIKRLRNKDIIGDDVLREIFGDKFIDEILNEK